MRLAAATSSKVARKAATNSVGRFDTNPTVSDRIARSKPGILTLRMVGSSVANSKSSAMTDACVMRLKRVDLPALV
jgi:hypothetical protein